MSSLSNKEIAEKLKNRTPLYVSVKDNYPIGRVVDIRTDKHGTFIMVDYSNYTLAVNTSVPLKKYYLNKFDCKFADSAKDLRTGSAPTFTKKDRKAFIKSCIPIGEAVSADNPSVTTALYGIIGVQKDSNGEMLLISVKKFNADRTVDILSYVLDKPDQITEEVAEVTPKPKKVTTRKPNPKKPSVKKEVKPKTEK